MYPRLSSNLLRSKELPLLLFLPPLPSTEMIYGTHWDLAIKHWITAALDACWASNPAEPQTSPLIF